jgi:O-acetyl-ADP-ribose deacetylase (regulator of RNase III)
MKYLHGNLLDMAEAGKFDIIIQGCNCFNTMGSGIAKQIKERYPKAYLADQLTQKADVTKLGKFTQAHINGTSLVESAADRRRNYNFTIINAYTQYNYGFEKVHLDYAALAGVFKQIKLLYDMNPQAPARIGIPMIGAGLAGGDWELIEIMIDGMGFSDLTCVVYKEI